MAPATHEKRFAAAEPPMAPRFGTSGWRAVLGDEFTVANVRLVCRAIAEHVRETAAPASRGAPEILVGYDTRFLSERFASVAAEALADGGLRPLLCDLPLFHGDAKCLRDPASSL